MKLQESAPTTASAQGQRFRKEKALFTAEMLAPLDVIVIDLQDVGARIYTYIYTMANCLRACARHGVPVIVCDRPNPIGGLDVEGARLVPGFESFVGQFPIPMRHGMTIGELAAFFNEAFSIGARLEVVKMEGWRRDMYANQTGLPWVMPSPNMPTLQSAMVYPALVAFEASNLSVGRGTPNAFQIVGAPWLKARETIALLREREIRGVRFIFEEFTPQSPTDNKYANQKLQGIRILVTDRTSMQPSSPGRIGRSSSHARPANAPSTIAHSATSSSSASRRGRHRRGRGRGRSTIGSVPKEGAAQTTAGRPEERPAEGDVGAVLVRGTSGDDDRDLPRRAGCDLQGRDPRAPSEHARLALHVRRMDDRRPRVVGLRVRDLADLVAGRT